MNETEKEYDEIPPSWLISKRGWTRGMITKYLKDVSYRETLNPNCDGYRAKMKLYRIEDIEKIEKINTFKEEMLKLEKRREKRRLEKERIKKLEEEERERKLKIFNSEHLAQLDVVLNRYKTANKKKTEYKKAKWQEDCLKAIKDKDNVILSSPTGSGKTDVFLEWIAEKKNKITYITAPIKALSNQRYRELKEKNYKVGIETGDIKLIPSNCEVICCTQEIYTNKYMQDKNSTLIIDEFHYIFENNDRARTYIDALNGTKAKNIFVCSGTFGDVNKIKEYVDRISGRNFLIYKNEQRLTEIEFNGYIPESDITDALVVVFSKDNCIKIENKIACIRENFIKNEEQYNKIITERLTKIKKLAKEQKIALNLDNIKYGVTSYYGALLPKEKRFIEVLFEKRLIDVVVGTDALSLGVNFPVEKVVFTQLAKYYDGPISKNLFDQISGRAGRKLYFDKGKVFYCDDFYVESYYYDTKELYNYIVNKKNENINVKLYPNIASILQGKTTVDKEAKFITDFSTKELSLEEITADINSIIKYVKKFNLTKNAICEKFGYYKKSYREKINLDKLQYEFDNNIANVYYDEYDEIKNCTIFSYIIQGLDINTIIDEKKVISEDIYSLLRFRAYLRRLPKKYRNNLDISLLEDKINAIDETVLNMKI